MAEPTPESTDVEAVMETRTWPEPWTRAGLIEVGLRAIPVVLLGVVVGGGQGWIWCSIGLGLLPAFLLQRRAARVPLPLALRVELVLWSGLAAWAGFLAGALNGIWLASLDEGREPALRCALAAWKGLSEPLEASALWQGAFPWIAPRNRCPWWSDAPSKVALLAAGLFLTQGCLRIGLRRVRGALATIAVSVPELVLLAGLGALVAYLAHPVMLNWFQHVGNARTWVGEPFLVAGALAGASLWTGEAAARIVTYWTDGGRRSDSPPPPRPAAQRILKGAVALLVGAGGVHTAFVGAPGHVAPRLPDRWLRALTRGEPEARLAAVREMEDKTQFIDEAVVLELEGLALDPDPELSTACVKVLFRLWPDQRSRPGVEDLLGQERHLAILARAARDPDHQVRALVTWRLDLRRPAEDDLFVQLLRDPDARVRGYAGQRIVHLDDERLGALLLVPDPELRWQAANVVAERRGSRAFLPGLLRLARDELDSQDHDHSLRTFDSLLRLILESSSGGPTLETCTALRSLLSKSSGWRRERLIESLGKLRDDSALPDLQGLVEGGALSDRLAAISALASFEDPSRQIEAALLVLVQDEAEDPQVRTRAGQSLTTLRDRR